MFFEGFWLMVFFFFGNKDLVQLYDVKNLEGFRDFFEGVDEEVFKYIIRGDVF